MKPDSEYQNKIPLWRAFRECEERTKTKQKNMKGKAFGHHKLPDGRSFTYSKTKREKIPLEIIQRIRYVHVAIADKDGCLLIRTVGCLMIRTIAWC